MTRDVKRRPYHSPRRREQAEATRRQILEAAQRLFERQGYVATSMAAVAAEAGVALKTVYVAFESKRGLLLALRHVLLRANEEAAPIAERESLREVVDESDPQRQLLLDAHSSRIVKERAAPLMAVLRDAAPADPELGALWERIQVEFYEEQRSIAESLFEKQALRRGLTVDRATDVLWSLNHPDLYTLLVRDCGWSPEQYEHWLGDILCSQLLA